MQLTANDKNTILPKMFSFCLSIYLTAATDTYTHICMYVIVKSTGFKIHKSLDNINIKYSMKNKQKIMICCQLLFSLLII